MINPNRATSEDVLRRLKEASYERMRVELKCSVELKMKEFDMTWDDIGRLLGEKCSPKRGLYGAEVIKHKIVSGSLTLNDLNTITHIFSCEPYVIFRPRTPWTKT